MTAATQRGRFDRWEMLCAVLLALLLASWSLHLWPQWRGNPDLSHGLFMPLVFVLLVHEARARGTQRFLNGGAGLALATGSALVAGTLLVAIGGLYAAAVGWTHALVAFVLAGGVCALLTAGWLVAASRTVRILPFNWPAATAVYLWLLCAPIPPGSYTRLTQALQNGVTTVVLHALHMLGIAAFQIGNVIELPNVSVGVEEACSGVRSLISCVFAGFFFSATLVRRPWARAVVILAAAPLAIGMNVLRSLALTLLAHDGVEIRGAWHDLTGFAVLGATAALLAGLAFGLSRIGSRSAVSTRADLSSEDAAHNEGAPAAGWLKPVVAGGYALIGLIVVFFFVQTRPAIPSEARPPPSLSAALPAEFTGWQVATSDTLYSFSPQLQTDHLFQRSYARATPAGPAQLTVYLAYWPPGRAAVSLVASHTPDACWPGAGWALKPGGSPRVQLGAIADRQLPDAEYRLFEQNQYPQHVWYWHLYNGRPIYPDLPNSPRRLLALAWAHGFQKEGDQLFVRVSSNRPWAELAQEPLVQEIVARLQRLGL